MNRISMITGVLILMMAVPAAFAAGNKDANPCRNLAMMDMGQMQQQMQKMQDLMQKIHQSGDMKQRRQLLNEHMREMQATMGMMRHGMMGGGGSGMMSGSGGRMGTMTTGQCMERMVGQMNMMQQMMGQMIQHEGMMK